MEARFEVFGSKEEVKKGLQELWKGQIEKDFGISLSDADFASVDASLEKTALENPEEILELKAKLESYQASIERIKLAEETLEQLGNAEITSTKLDELKDEQSTLSIARKYSGNGGAIRYAFTYLKNVVKGAVAVDERVMDFFNVEFKPTEFYSDYKKESKQFKEETSKIEKFGEIGKLDREKIDTMLEGVVSEISKVEEILTNIKDASGMKEMSTVLFDKLRKDLLKGVSGVAEFKNLIQEKAKKRLENMVGNPVEDRSMKDLEEAQGTFEGLRNSSKTSETGIDALGGVDQVEFQKGLNEAIEKKTSEDIFEAVMHSKLGKGAFDNLNKALSKFVENKKIGSKEGDEARKFIITAIEEVVANMGNDKEDIAKKLMCAEIINNMKKN
jgi:hypothetical protein